MDLLHAIKVTTQLKSTTQNAEVLLEQKAAIKLRKPKKAQLKRQNKVIYMTRQLKKSNQSYIERSILKAHKKHAKWLGPKSTEKESS